MISNLKKIFLDKGIFLKESWLYSMVDSGYKTYESILIPLVNTDISETCEPCNLPDISKMPIYIFKEEGGDFTSNQIFLQINEVADISLPLENRRALERSKRSTFKILLTDGINKYVAISKSPITSFSTDVTPGSKIFVKAPFEARYGIIFLSEEKIKFLNGKSDQVINHRKLVYSKIPPKSRQKQNQQPQPPVQIQKSQQEKPSNQTAKRNQTNRFLIESSDDDEDFSNFETMRYPKVIKTNDKSEKEYDNSIESDFNSELSQDDIEQFDESEFENMPTFSEKRKIENKQKSLSISEKQKAENKQINSSISGKRNSKIEINLSDYDDDYDVVPIENLNNTNTKQYLSDSDIEFSEIDDFQSGHFFTVDELKKRKNIQKECFEIIKTSARICECRNFELIDDKKKISITVVLTDSTGEISVKVNPDSILKTVQYNPKDFIKMDEVALDDIFNQMNDIYLKMKPPYDLIDRGGSIDERYTLTY